MTLLGRSVYYIWGYNVYIFIRFYLVSSLGSASLQGRLYDIMWRMTWRIYSGMKRALVEGERITIIPLYFVYKYKLYKISRECSLIHARDNPHILPLFPTLSPKWRYHIRYLKKPVVSGNFILK